MTFEKQGPHNTEAALKLAIEAAREEGIHKIVVASSTGATAKKLAELPGVGPAMAEQILTYREEHGSFTSIEELQQVKGIGQAKYDKLKDKVSV